MKVGKDMKVQRWSNSDKALLIGFVAGVMVGVLACLLFIISMGW